MKKKNIYFFNGYLGSGKTTLINQLLQSKNFTDKSGKIFIIENEMASYSVDNQCLHLDPKQIKVIAGECICCADPKELIKILKQVHLNNYDSVIIESSGVTSMNQLLEKILQDFELNNIFEIKACVLVVDALGLERTNIFDLEVSDFVVVTKMDAINLENERKKKKVEKFISQDFSHVKFHIKENETDQSWIVDLLHNPEKSFRDWSLQINSAKYHGQNFVKIINEKFLENMSENEVSKIYENMFLYQIVRIKGFCKIQSRVIHLEMTPEQMRKEEKPKQNLEVQKLGLVIIGENQLLLNEFIGEFFN